MGKPKSRVRAQRKFAQGAYIPPQNNPSTSAPPASACPSHKAGSAPGPVTYHDYSCRDLLTRMSLGSVHYHDFTHHAVRLENNNDGLQNKDTVKQKRKRRKSKPTLSTMRRKYLLRKRRKSVMPSTRRASVSISDSGEDTPLSCLRLVAHTSPLAADGEKPVDVLVADVAQTAAHPKTQSGDKLCKRVRKRLPATTLGFTSSITTRAREAKAALASAKTPEALAAADSRLPVVRITPLEDDPELSASIGQPAAQPPAQQTTALTATQLGENTTDATELVNIIDDDDEDDFPPLRYSEDDDDEDDEPECRLISPSKLEPFLTPDMFAYLFETEDYNKPYKKPSFLFPDDSNPENQDSSSSYTEDCIPYLDPCIFRPTKEEFEDPIIYIKKIEPIASAYGMCRIIPPDDFHVPCHLDDNSVFKTMNQYLGRQYQRWGSNSSEMISIQTYVAMLANPRERDQFTKAPMFDGIELDLVKLYHLVLEHGGIEKLLAHSEKWARIAEQMPLVSPRGKPDPKKLEKLYCKHVLPYESLSQCDRKIIREKVEKVWVMRMKGMFKRSRKPLFYQQRLMGEAASDDEEEAPDPDVEDVYAVGKPCFDRVEECTSKGRPMNLATFRRIADQIKAMRFPNIPFPSTIDVEADYWKIINTGEEHVCVLSAFIDTSVANLGHQANPAAPGGKHPWNLKRLGENPLNVLHSLGKTLSVTVPTLCLNQLYSTNCWHMDPHQLAWMDYMHEGSPKIWYAVPKSAAESFRSAVEALIPTAVQNKGIWLTSDTTMLPPGILIKMGVPIQRLEQHPNEFIVVFPGAYACSIASGLTISESIYFEGKNWLQNINNIFGEMRQDCEPAMFSSTLLLMRMARDQNLHNDTLHAAYTAIQVVLREEFDCRRLAKNMKCKIILDQVIVVDDRQTAISWPHQEECCVCRTPLILSKMSRHNDPRSLMCLSHGLRVLKRVPIRQRAKNPVILLYSNEELEGIFQALEDRIMKSGTALIGTCN